jgi:energy-coupling factor transport system ATP-binding protein
VTELRAEHVFFQYPASPPIITDLNLRVHKGEKIVVLGENSSGKTTLLHLLAGLKYPEHGSVTLDEFPITERRDRVGILFQNPDHQMIASTVEEEIALGLELRGIEQKIMRVAVDTMLLRFHLEDIKHKSPESLSGGQKQRVALAAIMISNPDFLLLDEPDSYLDARGRFDFLETLKDASKDCGVVWAVSRLHADHQANRYLRLEGGQLAELDRLRVQAT